jgi:HSP20 family protein
MMFRQSFSWNEMDRLRRDFDRLFEGSFPALYRQRSRSFPAINIWSNETEGVIVTAELPGMAAEDVTITATGDTLTISGSCQPVEEVAGEQMHRQERLYREFNRDVQLPFTIDMEGVEAAMNKGVLRVTLPRAEAEKPKQISIKAAA